MKGSECERKTNLPGLLLLCYSPTKKNIYATSTVTHEADVLPEPWDAGDVGQHQSLLTLAAR